MWNVYIIRCSDDSLYTGTTTDVARRVKAHNNKRGGSYLFANLADVWQRLGRQPVYRDLDKAAGYSKFSVGTYEKRFGSWNKALEIFVAYVNSSLQDNSKMGNNKEKKQRSGHSRRTPRNINWRLRAMVLIRDNCICRMCGASPSKDPSVVLHVDHVKPWSKGGETYLENLQTLCSVCNIGKSDETI